MGEEVGGEMGEEVGVEMGEGVGAGVGTEAAVEVRDGVLDKYGFVCVNRCKDTECSISFKCQGNDGRTRSLQFNGVKGWFTPNREPSIHP